jgi:hypothetical protein
VTGVVVRLRSQNPDEEDSDQTSNAQAVESTQFPAETSIEVHVSVDAAALLASPAAAPSEIAASEPVTGAPDQAPGEDSVIGLLPAIAAEIRSAVRSATQSMGLPADVAVDVFIDDLD